MTPFLSFILKANLALIVLYGSYYLFFRRDTFYGYIRWFFLASIAASVLFPLIHIELPVTSHPTISEISQQIPAVVYRFVLIQPQIESPIETAAPQTIPFTAIFLWIWLSVAGFMLAGRLFQLANIIRLRRKYPRKRFGAGVITEINKNIQPFSFFNRIFLNSSLYTDEELNEIITHEQVHCRQGHTIDILLVETLVCLFWFNPAVWLLRHDLKQNIEYYTDRRTLSLSSFDRKHYQYSLLRVSDSSFQIVNHFHLNNLKKRIIMMNKKESPRIMTAKYLLVIPALAAALLIVQISGLQASKSVSPVEKSLALTNAIALPTAGSVESVIPAKAPGKKNSAKLQSIVQDTLGTSEIKQKQVEKDNSSIIPANSAGEDSSLINLIKKYNQTVLEKERLLSYAKEDAPIIKKINERLALVKQDIITFLKASGISDNDGENAANGVIIVTTKRKINSDSQQAEATDISGCVTNAKDGKPLPGVVILVKGSKSGTVTDSDGKYTMIVPEGAILQFSYIGMDTREIAVNNQSQINVMLGDETGTPLFFVDGKEVAGLQNISPETIESVSVLKGASAVNSFGEKGKNGAVLITLKK